MKPGLTLLTALLLAPVTAVHPWTFLPTETAAHEGAPQ